MAQAQARGCATAHARFHRIAVFAQCIAALLVLTPISNPHVARAQAKSPDVAGLPACNAPETLRAVKSAIKNSPAGKRGLELSEVLEPVQYWPNPTTPETPTERNTRALLLGGHHALVLELLEDGIGPANARYCGGTLLTNAGKKGGGWSVSWLDASKSRWLVEVRVGY